MQGRVSYHLDHKTGVTRRIEMALSAEECCLLERLRQLRNEALKSDANCGIMVIVEVGDTLSWRVAKKVERPPQDAKQ